MFRDIQFGLKLLWKHPSYAITAILTLTVCLGANLAIFTIVNSVLLKPLPVPDSDRILLISNQYPNAGLSIAVFVWSSAGDYYDRLRELTVFEEQAMYSSTDEPIELDGSAERIHGISATPSLFRLLGVSPIQGRVFQDSEGEVGNEQKVILSYGLWQQLYAGRPDILGQDIRLGGRPFTIVGVMPAGFTFPEPISAPEARFWIPLAFSAERKQARLSDNWYHVGRLKPGATATQVQQQVNAVNAANMERFPQYKQIWINAGFHTRVDRLQDVLVRNIRPTLYFLWVGATFLLLTGGVNIANLALARSNLRMKELSTRLALGAAHSQVARQMVIENLLLSVIAGAGSILAGQGILRSLQRIGIERIPRAGEIHMDVAVIGAAAALSLMAGVLIGLVPVIHLWNLNIGTVLHEESRTGTGGRKIRAVRRLLVVAQVALAFVLLIGSGLLLASFRNLLTVDAGFRADGVATASIGLPRALYPSNKDVRSFTDRVLKAIRNIPGVISAGGTTIIPLGGDHDDNVIMAEGYEMKPGESVIAPTQVTITPDYFETMGTRLIHGRYFTDHDNEMSPNFVIVDERLARRFWPGIDPVGKRMFQPTNPADLFKVDEKTRWYTVVGVVREVQLEDLAGLKGAAGVYYFPAAQATPRNLTIAIKTRLDPTAVLRSVRDEIHKINPSMPVSNTQTMDEYIAQSLMSRKAAMILATSFGLLSLFLSAVGIYGVLAYLTTQRSREIGIRIALGSTNRGIFKLILQEGFLLVVCGLAIGLAGAVALRRVLEAQLYGLGSMDPVVIGTALTLLTVIVLAACALPARRATRLDPVVVLNQQ